MLPRSESLLLTLVLGLLPIVGLLAALELVRAVLSMIVAALGGV